MKKYYVVKVLSWRALRWFVCLHSIFFYNIVYEKKKRGRAYPHLAKGSLSLKLIIPPLLVFPTGAR